MPQNRRAKMKMTYKYLLALTILLLIISSVTVGVKYVSAQSEIDLPPKEVSQVNAQLDGEKALLAARYVTSSSSTTIISGQRKTVSSPTCPSGYKFIAPLCSTSLLTCYLGVSSKTSGESATCSAYNNSQGSSCTLSAAAVCMSGI
jgi:hypothetical protein